MNQAIQSRTPVPAKTVQLETDTRLVLRGQVLARWSWSRDRDTEVRAGAVWAVTYHIAMNNMTTMNHNICGSN